MKCPNCSKQFSALDPHDICEECFSREMAVLWASVKRPPRTADPFDFRKLSERQLQGRAAEMKSWADMWRRTGCESMAKDAEGSAAIYRGELSKREQLASDPAVPDKQKTEDAL